MPMIDTPLAVDGGSPVRERPFPVWPRFDPEEIEAVSKVLASGRVNYWTGGEGSRFERRFARIAGCNHAVALSNGTAALETALRAIGIGPGDEVVVPSRTFIATASSVVMTGAIPVVADIDARSQNLTAATILDVLTPRTRAVIAVHLAGWPCDIDAIREVTQARGLAIIEDCAQAHGASYKGRPVGSLGDVAAFSFCQDKIMTTGGEGGMLTTDDEETWSRAWSFKDHGKDYHKVNLAGDSGFRWLHDTLGTNLRLTEMQSAIGNHQIAKLEGWVKARRAHASVLSGCFSGIEALRVTEPPAGFGHSYYRYYAFVEKERLHEGWDRDRIMNAIVAEGIPCFSGSCSEIYLEKAFRAGGIAPAGRLPVARELGETSLAFLVDPALEATDVEDTCRAVEKVFGRASA